MIRGLLDTNIVVSALLKLGGAESSIAERVGEGRLTPPGGGAAQKLIRRRALMVRPEAISSRGRVDWTCATVLGVET